MPSPVVSKRRTHRSTVARLTPHCSHISGYLHTCPDGGGASPRVWLLSVGAVDEVFGSPCKTVASLVDVIVTSSLPKASAFTRELCSRLAQSDTYAGSAPALSRFTQ